MSDQDLDQKIESEVQRRLALKVRSHNDQINELQSTIKQCHSDLIRQNDIIGKLTINPLTYGVVLKTQNFVEKSQFKFNDEIIVTDKDLLIFQKGGKIVGDPDNLIDEEGRVLVKLVDDTEVRLSIGLEGKRKSQIRLTKKSDGTFTVIHSDNKFWEVKGVPDLDLKIGDPVKIKADTKAIIAKGEDFNYGPICNVVSVCDNFAEIYFKGDSLFVNNLVSEKLERGDRVLVDSSLSYVIKKLPNESKERYKVNIDSNLSWGDVGGLASAKQELRNALEYPILHKDLFNFYKMQSLRGILLYGPPGNGKTLLVRVAASVMAKMHGLSSVSSGYVYVKSPEILDKWVGNTEKEIHALFEFCREHYRKYGYKSILTFDEAEAIMPQRGSRRSSDVADTIVPMFLGEMDGVDSKQTEENPIVCLLTNRPETLDPAITRPGRISRHIKIERPNELASIDILNIHSKNLPFESEKNKDAILTIAATDIFSRSRLLYRVNNEHDFTLGDCVSGAMLENIAEIAKMNALHRDLEKNTQTGLTVDDFRNAVTSTFNEQKGMNHNYDLQDFAEKLGIQAGNMKIDRCFGAC